MEEEVQNYEYQIQELKEKLENDPSNEEIKQLISDLEEIIDVTRELIKESTPSQIEPKTVLKSHKNSSEKSQVEASLEPKTELEEKKTNFNIGDIVLARSRSSRPKDGPESKSGDFEEARIEAFDPMNPNNRCSVTFTASGLTTFVDITDMKEIKEEDEWKLESLKKRKRIAKNDQNLETQKKSKKLSYEERIAKKELEAQSKQNAWQAFAKKSGILDRRQRPSAQESKRSTEVGKSFSGQRVPGISVTKGKPSFVPSLGSSIAQRSNRNERSHASYYGARHRG